MPGHLILVVHGIGEQKPGETVDAVLAGAIAEHERASADDSGQRNAPPVDVQTDVVHIPRAPFDEDVGEDEYDNENRHMSTFPLHLRKVRAADALDDPHTTLADVYWADVSPAPSGKLWTAIELIRTVLGIGYLAMENAKSLGGRASFGLVALFTALFFAGIASINTLLFVGVAILVVVQLTGLLGFWPDVALPELLTSLNGLIVLVMGAIMMLKGAKTRLVAQYARGLIGTGVIVQAYVLASVLDADTVIWIIGLATYFSIGAAAILGHAPKRRWLGWLLAYLAATGFLVCAIMAFAAARSEVPGGTTIPLVRISNPPATEYFAEFIGTAISIMGLIWAFALILCLALYAISMWERSNEEGRDGPSDEFDRLRRIYPSICTALLLLWMVFASSFWVFMEYLIRNPLGMDSKKTLLETLFDVELSGVLGGMTIAVMMFFLLLGAAAWVAGRRMKLRDVVDRAEHSGARRLLLNRVFQGVFLVAFICIGFVVAHIYASRIAFEVWNIPSSLYQPEFVSRSGQRVVAVLGDLENYASLVLLLMAFAIYNLFGRVSDVLGIVRDITGYATMQRLSFATRDRAQNFIYRDLIETRFERVLRLTVRAVKPDRLTIISHSLGTVVATRVLGRIAGKRGEDGLPDATWLVTMGSPVTHIYRKYFPGNFEVAPVLLGDRINWINIFRCDDFVGTKINLPEREVSNFRVGAAGHSGYFTDSEVWSHLGKEAGIRLLWSGGEDGNAQDQDADPAGGEDDRAGRHLSNAGDHTNGMGHSQPEEGDGGPIGQRAEPV